MGKIIKIDREELEIIIDKSVLMGMEDVLKEINKELINIKLNPSDRKKIKVKIE